MNNEFEFINTVKIINGQASINKIPYELTMLRCKHPLILSDNGIKTVGSLDTIINILEKSSIDAKSVFTDIPKDSSTKTINQIIALYKINRCDGILAVGGGSVIDTAKGVKFSLSQNSTDIKQLMGVEFAQGAIRIPFIVVPTTCGTGSECTTVAVIKDDVTHIKMEIITKELLPDCAILDANLILTLPNRLVATTSIDALCHAIEAFSGKQKNVICDSFAFTAIKLIKNNLLLAIKKPKVVEYKQNLILASSLAGICFSNSMVGIVHAIGHSLGSVLNIPHGLAMAMLLPVCLRFNIERNREHYTELAKLFNLKELSAEGFIEDIENFISEVAKEASTNLSISSYEPTQEKFEKVAKLSLTDGAILMNSKKVNFADVVNILSQIK